MTVNKIGSKIRDLRINKKNWSQEELAIKLGITQTNISAIESGKPDKIDFLLMDKLCKIFEVDFSYFLEPNNQKQIIKGEKAIGYMADIQNFSLSELIIDQFEKRILLLEKLVNDKDELIEMLKKDTYPKSV